VETATTTATVRTATAATTMAASAVLRKGRTRRAYKCNRCQCSENHFQKGGTFHLFILHPTPA
jgi:hypothetical protein